MSKVILFSKEEVDFASRGLGTLKECIICTIKERKNGLFELYMEYPLYGRKTDLIQEERIIQTSTPRGDNIFRIYNIKQDDKEGIKKVYASQIFYDLEDNFIEDTNIINKDGIGAINQLLDKTQYTHKFKGLSDIANIANSRLVRRSPVTAIMDTSEENSLLNRWGGEIQRDNFNISLLTRYGSDRGVKIKYGKNLLGLTVETNMKAVATKIMPQGFDGLFLPEKYVDSPLLGSYAHPKILKYEFPSIKAQVEGEELKEGELPLEQAYQALREEVNKLYSEQKIDIPPTNLKVNFLELVKTEEYKNYAVLERVYPFDTVTIKHSRLNLNIKVDMVYYEWDSLRDRYITIEFGNTISSFVETVARIATVKRQMDELEASALKQAKETATGLINNGLGGYVLKTRDELLIMDTDDINTAQKIWRWNLNGLGYSSTGYNGTFGLAMTSDGAIVADFITAGMLNAGLIKTGVLTAITIQNSDASFQIDLSGTGGASFFSNGNLAMRMEYNSLKLYNPKKSGDYVGALAVGNYGSNDNIALISLAHDQDALSCIGYRKGWLFNTVSPYIFFDKYNLLGQGYPIMFNEATRFVDKVSHFGNIEMNNYRINMDAANAAYISSTTITGSSPSNDPAVRVGNSLWVDQDIYANATKVNNADYAEYFEWADGNTEDEDRVGYIVSLEGEMIIKANDDNILGVISATPAISGDSAHDYWSKKYLTDEWGRFLYEEVPATYDVEGNIVAPAYAKKILNPEYDSTKEYIPRSMRKEWDTVGLVGKLLCRDDGTANVGDYITAINGIATKSNIKTRLRVMKRIGASTIKVFAI